MNISLEIGFRFLPPDEEIISFFLKNKMIGGNDRTGRITEIDLLKHAPWELPAMSIVQSTYKEWFFFYKLNKISERKNDRLTTAGFWKSTGTDRPISYGGRVVGAKKTLVFYKGRTPHGVKTDWVMHEFRASADFIPPNAENSYVVGYLRNTAAEKTENSISNVGQPSTHFAASTSQNNALVFTSTEVVPQLQSNSMDYQIALQTQMEDGIFDYDLSPSNGHDLLSSSVTFNIDQSRIEEEGFSLEDLDFRQSHDLDDEERNEWLLPFDTFEEEMEFMASMFPDQDERPYVEAGRMLRPDYRAPDYAGNSSDTDLKWANARSFMSDGTGHGHSEGFNQKRMENGVHHDEILIMDSRVESAKVTAHEINCREPVQEERSVNSRICKSLYEPRSHKSVVQGHSRRVQLQGESLGKAVFRDKTRESGVRGPVVELVRNNKSIVQSNKGPKMDRDRNTKLGLNSRSNGSAGSSRKNSFNLVEMSQQNCKLNPPLVYVRNVLLGVILFIAVVWGIMFLH